MQDHASSTQRIGLSPRFSFAMGRYILEMCTAKEPNTSTVPEKYRAITPLLLVHEDTHVDAPRIQGVLEEQRVYHKRGYKNMRMAYPANVADTKKASPLSSKLAGVHKEDEAVLQKTFWTFARLSTCKKRSQFLLDGGTLHDTPNT